MTSYRVHYMRPESLRRFIIGIETPTDAWVMVLQPDGSFEVCRMD